MPNPPPAEDPLSQSRLEALQDAVGAGVQALSSGRLIDGRVVEHELRQELESKLEQQQRRKAHARRGP